MAEEERTLTGEGEISPEMGESIPETAPEAAPGAVPAPAAEAAPGTGQAEAIAAAVAEARARWQAEQEEQVARAVAAERQRYDALTREQALGQALGEAGLNPAFAPLLRGENQEEDRARLALFQTLLRAQLSDAVAQRMRGAEIPREPGKPQGYDRARLSAMSAREINEQWEAISAAMEQQ